MSDYFDLISRRESCRDYADTPVEREKLVRCVEAARLSPSACNSQPWSYLVVTDPALVTEVRKAVQGMGMNGFTDGVNAFAIVIEEPAMLSERVLKRFKSQDLASIDIGLSVSQFCYAATEQGLSTCILGWQDEARLKKLLDVSGGRRVRLVLAVGYAAADALRTKKRKPIEQMSRFYE